MFKGNGVYYGNKYIFSTIPKVFTISMRIKLILYIVYSHIAITLK